ncbi:MAG: hypothetical protein AAGG75_09835 [Bacteroidota bacterium]
MSIDKTWLSSHPFSQHQLWPLFQESDSLKWYGNHRAAAEQLERLLRSNSQLDNTAKYYAWNQLAYHYLIAGQLDKAAAPLTQLDHYSPAFESTPALLADYYFNKGLYKQKKSVGEESLYYLRKARALYSQLYPPTHPYRMWALTELAFSFQAFTYHVDSIIFYADQANTLLMRHSQLHFQAPRTYYAQAEACWKRRAHIEGENRCQLALEAARYNPDLDVSFVAQCISLKGKFIQKQKDRKEEGEKVLKAAIRLVESKGTLKEEDQVLYKNLLSYYARAKDSLAFFSFLDHTKQAFMKANHPFRYIEQMRGLYYNKQKAFCKSIQYYEEFLAYYLNTPAQESAIVEEAYFLLVKNYRGLDELDQAEVYAWKLMALRLGKRTEKLTWENLFEEENKNQLHIYVGYHLLAQIYIQGYEGNKQSTNLLHRAYQLYQLIDEMIYDRLDSFDEDAWLSAYRMYNSDIYRSSVKVCYYLYTSENNNSILEWTLHFIRVHQLIRAAGIDCEKLPQWRSRCVTTVAACEGGRPYRRCL